MDYNDFSYEDYYEPITILDEMDSISFHDNLENMIARMGHNRFVCLTKHFFCHYQTNQHKPIIELWIKRWGEFNKLPKEQQKIELNEGKLTLYAIALYIKRHGVEKFMCEIQELYANFNEDTYFPQDDEEEKK